MRAVRSSSMTVVDVLDRVLDKGIVIDARVRVSLAGIEVIAVDARVVVASIATYAARSPALDLAGARRAAPPATEPSPARPARRANRRRSPGARVATTSQTLRCADGCTFQRRVDATAMATRLPDVRPCPYGQRRVCVLRPA